MRKKSLFILFLIILMILPFSKIIMEEISILMTSSDTKDYMHDLWHDENRSKMPNLTEYCNGKGFLYAELEFVEESFLTYLLNEENLPRIRCFNNELKLCKYNSNNEYEEEHCYATSVILNNYIIFGLYYILFLIILILIYSSRNKLKLIIKNKIPFVLIFSWSFLIALLLYFIYLNNYYKNTWLSSVIQIKIFMLIILLFFSFACSLFCLNKRMNKLKEDSIFSFILNSFKFSIIVGLIFALILVFMKYLPNFLAVTFNGYIIFELLAIGLIGGILFSFIYAPLSSLIVELSKGKGFLYNLKNLRWKYILISLAVSTVILALVYIPIPLMHLHKYNSYAFMEAFVLFVVPIVIPATLFALFIAFIIPYIFSKKNPKTNGMVAVTIAIFLILGFLLISSLLTEKEDKSMQMPTVYIPPIVCENSSMCKDDELCINKSCNKLECGEDSVAFKHNCIKKYFVTKKDVWWIVVQPFRVKMIIRLKEPDDILINLDLNRAPSTLVCSNYFINNKSIGGCGSRMIIKKENVKPGENIIELNMTRGYFPSFYEKPLKIYNSSYIASPSMMSALFLDLNKLNTIDEDYKYCKDYDGINPGVKGFCMTKYRGNATDFCLGEFYVKEMRCDDFICRGYQTDCVEYCQNQNKTSGKCGDGACICQ